jgi:hypothetical protein
MAGGFGVWHGDGVFFSGMKIGGNFEFSVFNFEFVREEKEMAFLRNAISKKRHL